MAYEWGLSNVKQCFKCNYNEDGFCLVNLEDCKKIRLKKECSNFQDKEIDWNTKNSPYEEYGKLFEEWVNGQF